MGEFYPINNEDLASNVTEGALMAVASHWRAYNSLPARERLGDEDTWDIILPVVLMEVGFEPSKAHELCVIAKLNAQL